MSKPAEVILIGLLVCSAMVGGCSGAQSVLDPKGDGAAGISILALVLFTGGMAVLVIVVVATVIALWGPERFRRALSAERAVVVGGVGFPVVVLTALLTYGVLLMAPPGRGEKPMQIAVEGKQWWWRVTYVQENGAFETANEIRVPVGRPVEFILSSSDVIHSFWVPNLAGKVDMTPGRTTRLTAVATEPGIMRGQCAEFCGGPHGLMSLRVIAMQPADFDAWTARARGRDAAVPGHELFLSLGCGGCHSIDGTKANGSIGPNLTDVGARAMLAAETLPNTHQNLQRWITAGQLIKPQNAMPEFKHLKQSELSTLSIYLMGLK